MKGKAKNAWIVACACACAGIIFTGGVAFRATKTEVASAAEVPESKVYYYVDCGNYVKNSDGTGELTYRDANGNNGYSYPSTQITGWMTAHNLTFGTSDNHGEGENVLYNSVTDKPFGTDGKGGEAEGTEGTGKKWGFTSGGGDDATKRWDFGSTRDGKTTDNEVQTGFNTTRFQDAKNAGDGSIFQYKFQVDNDTDNLAIIIGTKNVLDWGTTRKGDLIINGENKGEITSEEKEEKTYYFEGKGTEESGEYYITLKFGSTPSDVQISWILIATGNHETIKTYPGKPATYYTGYVREGTEEVHVKPYTFPEQTITLTDEQKNAINDAESFSNVTLNFATWGDNAKDYTYTVIPKEATYFINVGGPEDNIAMKTYKGTYSSENGYGRKEGNTTGGDFWADDPFYASTLGGNKGETFEYQFDLAQGNYAFAIGTYGRWGQTRVMNVTIDGTLKGELTSHNETAEHGTFYHYVEQAEGKKTVELSITNKDGQDEGYQFAYIIVYKVNKVTYDLNGGTGVEETQYYEPNASGALPEPTKEHYTFGGWYKTEEYQESEKVENLQGITENTELHAKWVAETYTVTFDHNYQGDTDTTASVEYNGHATAPETAPTRTGYDFGGWYKESTCDTEFDFAAEAITGDTTVYAKWTAHEYTITYELHEGTNAADAPAKFTYGEGVTELPTPTREGYTFKGWYTAAEGGDKVESIPTDKAENVTLHAQWTQNSTTDPGTTDPGTTDPGTTDPGTTDPTDPGTDDGEKGGCGSAIAAPATMLGAAVLALGIALVVRKRED